MNASQRIQIETQTEAKYKNFCFWMSGSGIILQVSWNFLQDSKGGGKKKKKSEKLQKVYPSDLYIEGKSWSTGGRRALPAPPAAAAQAICYLSSSYSRESRKVSALREAPRRRGCVVDNLCSVKQTTVSQHNWGGRVCWVRGQEANTPQSGNCHCEAAWRSGTRGCFLWAKNTVSTGSILKLRDKF